MSEGGTAFRVWANTAQAVSVLLEGAEHPLKGGENGYFSAWIDGARAGDHYAFRVDGEGPFPDPGRDFNQRVRTDVRR
jgi:maltooligosyltrehalose trehalohydrolase